MNPSNRLTGTVPTGEKNSVVTHRNIPPNSVLLPGQRGGGGGKGPPFFLPSRGSVSGVTTGVRKKKRVKREEKRKDR